MPCPIRGHFAGGEAALPDHKRRVLQYSGVVAWYCALKLELYASYVAAYDDPFAVYEWGSGGIVHLHALGFAVSEWNQRGTRTPNSNSTRVQVLENSAIVKGAPVPPLGGPGVKTCYSSSKFKKSFQIRVSVS